MRSNFSNIKFRSSMNAKIGSLYFSKVKMALKFKNLIRTLKGVWRIIAVRIVDP